jgi:hypothetical protein
MLVFVTVLPMSVISGQKSYLFNETPVGIKRNYKSLNNVLSPDGNSYRCIMFCDDQEQTLQWISLINETGFENAWQKKFIQLTIFLLLPGTVLLFGLDDFRNCYAELLVKLQHKNEYLNFLNTYDTTNGSGMITYLWLSGTTDKPIDFRAQPDNTWVENSWILDGDTYIPNPEIWTDGFLWYFDFPFDIS